MRVGVTGAQARWAASTLAATLAAILLQPVLPALAPLPGAPVVAAPSEPSDAEGTSDDAPESPSSPAEDGADDDGDDLDALCTHHDLAWPVPMAPTSEELSHADTHRIGHRTELDRPPRA